MKTDSTLSKQPIHAVKGGLKVGIYGTVNPPGLLFGDLSKGETRRLRKWLREHGYKAHAQTKRETF